MKEHWFTCRVRGTSEGALPLYAYTATKEALAADQHAPGGTEKESVILTADTERPHRLVVTAAVFKEQYEVTSAPEGPPIPQDIDLAAAAEEEAIETPAIEPVDDVPDDVPDDVVPDPDPVDCGAPRAAVCAIPGCVHHPQMWEDEGAPDPTLGLDFAPCACHLPAQECENAIGHNNLTKIVNDSMRINSVAADLFPTQGGPPADVVIRLLYALHDSAKE